MTRGAQKIRAQEKNAAKQKETKGTQRFDAAKKLTFVCPICRATFPGYKVVVDHYGAKHPKETCPPEDSFAK